MRNRERGERLQVDFEGLKLLAEGTDGSFRSNLEQHFDRELVPFAVAFTGTAISALSGAAATSATLAWLGGGSLAAGGMGMAGGTVVLASVVAIPVVLAGGAFVSYQGRKELAKQRGLARDLDSEQAQLLMDDGGAADRLGAIIATWGGTAPAHLAGRLLEWQQETTFNISAAGLGSDIRARLTELANEHTAASPHNPADLRIFAPDGSVLSEAQAKAVASTAQRIMGLSVDKYAGMQLIVPSDHLAPSQALLDARLDAANPGFLKHDQYVDVSHRLSDRIQYGDVSSTPIDSAHLRAAAEDPQFGQPLHGTENQREALRDARLAEESAQQRDALSAQIGGVVGAAVAGGAVAAGIAATVSTMRSIAAIRSGAVTPTAAAVSVAADAGRAFCQTALVAGSGQALRALARSGIGPDAFATGTLPFALSRASLSLGQIGWGYANGSVSGQDAAARSAESLARVSFAWAGALIGQVAIPVPVVGAMVGGVVGSLAATLAVQGITTIGALARDAELQQQALAEMQVQVAAALIVIQEENRWLRELAQQHDVAFSDIILPTLDRLDAVAIADVDAALAAASDLVLAHSGEPLFTTRAEFHAWMTDPGVSLSLIPNPPWA